MSNGAAERLREHMTDFHGNCPWVGEDHIILLDRALTAERVETTVGMLDAQEEVAIATRHVTVDRLKKRLGLDVRSIGGEITFAPGVLQRILEEVRT